MDEPDPLPGLLRSLRRITLPVEDKEDAAQDAEVALLMHKGEPPNNTLAWKVTAARRRAFKIARKKRACDTCDLCGVELAEADSAREVEQRDCARAVREAVAALPEDLRVVVVICYLEEKTGIEAACACGVRPSTVCRRLQQALEMLRSTMTARGLGPS
ncbi:sigma-70 family RNA polymerase sigma factor [Gemmata sp. G18]|uniref:Sigma-70 family RNA polymerase sigma factor n=1 Tax=Gemmata palustris TaxID=2822762 RepID=A0ABS5BKY2_9BACT|nr:sigma-70 family RNA polymerase sigma factor [Gemmata palustris]MBP3954367.1 sigma-70 family RNA polymerase sigma factor [Gemmata palustris]